MAAMVPPSSAGARAGAGHVPRGALARGARALAPQLDMAQEVALLDELEINHTGQAEAITGARLCWRICQASAGRW